MRKEIDFPGKGQALKMWKKHKNLAEAWRDYEHITYLYYHGTTPKGKPYSYQTIALLYQVSFATIQQIIATSRKNPDEKTGT
jgi:hypothetical protein